MNGVDAAGGRPPADALDRARALFNGQGLHVIAERIARADPYGIDYLEQAPVIAPLLFKQLFPTRAFIEVTRCDQGEITTTFRAILGKGRRLKDVMAALGAPYPLRRLRPRAVIGRRMTALQLLIGCPSSLLGQAIPDDEQQQAFFMDAVAAMTATEGLPVAFMHWMVGLLAEQILTSEARGGIGRLYLEVHTVTDFLRRCASSRWTPRWSWLQAYAAAMRWHEDLHREYIAADRLGAQRPEAPAEFGELPLSVTVDGFEFTALRTERELLAEGAELHHCVGSYWPEVRAGTSRIYGICSEGRRVATLELRTTGLTGRRWGIQQVQAHHNRPPGQAVADAVVAFYGEIYSMTATELVVLRSRFGFGGTGPQYCLGGWFEPEDVMHPREIHYPPLRR